MRALILSGGTGTRLRPLTYSGAKQLLPVANKPILFYLIEKVVRAGIREIGIIVGDTFAEIETAVGDGGKWGAKVTYIRQQLPLGLAHAVKTASDFLQDDSFIMLLGDNLFQMDLKEFVGEFESRSVNALILLHRSDHPSDYGVAVVEGEQVIRLVEKPKIPPSNLIITGIYLFDRTIFAAIDKTEPSARGELEITDAIQKLLEMGGKVVYKQTEGWWKDTGSLEDILDANRLVLDGLEAGMEPGLRGDGIPETRTVPEAGTIPEDGTVPKEGTVPDREAAAGGGPISDGQAILSGFVRAGERISIAGSILTGPVILGDRVSLSDCRLGPYVSVGGNTDLSRCAIENSILLEGCVMRNISKTVSSSLIGKNSSIETLDDAAGMPQAAVPGRAAAGEEQRKAFFFIGSDNKIIL